MYGYLLGFLFSTVIAVVAVYLMFVILVSMSFGGSNGGSSITSLLLVVGSYLLAAFILAVFARRIFSSNQGLAFALNVSSVTVVISLLFLVNQYGDYARGRQEARNARKAVEDAPYIHLEAPFVKKLQIPDGGVTLFLHVPFTVTKIVRSRSLMILAPLHLSENDIKFSANPYCNSGYEKPSYGFHLVDREFTESPLPSYVSGTEIVSEELLPEKRYYLLRELHFPYSGCKTSDYDDFDPQQLNITLNTSRAERKL